MVSERLKWTLSWQLEHLTPLLRAAGADDKLRRYWIQERRMDTVRALVPLDATTTSVDVGGGQTTPLRWLSGRRVCVDPLAQEYGEAGALPLGDVLYVVGSGENLPLISETVDMLVCTNCIDHTDDPWAVIDEIWRVLRPGGWLWFSCELRSPDKPRNAGHPHALDRSAIDGLVSEFELVLRWEEPWRGVYRFLNGREPTATTELGYLLRKPES